jgi:replicative DNA helicase
MMPYEQEIERAILGSLMSYERLRNEIMDAVNEDWFYEPSNRAIFSAMLKSWTDNKHIDAITVESLLRSAKKDDLANEVASLYAYGSTTANYEYHLNILRDAYQRRTVITSCHEITQQAVKDTADVCIDNLYNIATRISNSTVAKRSLPADKYLELEATKPKAEQIYTGERLFDESIYAHVGLKRGQIDLTIAESGHGKTHYAMFKASLLARKGYKVHWFQLEDYGATTAQHFKNVIPKHYQNVIITDSVFDIDEIKREARAIKREYNTDYIVIDYVQNVETTKQSRADQIEYVSGQVRRLAIDLNVAIHLLSQVTIDYNKRKGWTLEPRYSDVRWSQQLKQDAHIITSVFRPYVIDDLIEGEYAKDWKGQNINKNSVFCRQVKVRGGQMSHTRLHMIHTELGLQIMAHWQSETEQTNNAWRYRDDNSPF